MAKYYIRVTLASDKTKKQQKIAELLQSYHAHLVHGDQAKDAIANNIEDVIDDYNRLYKGRQNFVTLSKPSGENGSWQLQVHTEGSDRTSSLWFHVVVGEYNL